MMRSPIRPIAIPRARGAVRASATWKNRRPNRRMLTAFAIVASTGDIYAGLWYPIIFASITAVVGFFFLPETKDVDIKTN